MVTQILINIGSGNGCVMASSYYLNQCWLTIKGVLWHSPESKLRNAHDFNPQHIFKRSHVQNCTLFPWGQWVQKDTTRTEYYIFNALSFFRQVASPHHPTMQWHSHFCPFSVTSADMWNLTIFADQLLVCMCHGYHRANYIAHANQGKSCMGRTLLVLADTCVNMLSHIIY